MTVQAKESPLNHEHEGSTKTVSTTLSYSECTDKNKSEKRKLLKRVWKSILMGDLD